ncbi:MAG TPA: hypothetical protein DIT46_08095 [Gemmatimonadetes bacterium]|nr:hypothetical protein [Gemmatimonadota bacterium]
MGRDPASIHLTAPQLAQFKDSDPQNSRLLEHLEDCELCQKALMEQRMRGLSQEWQLQPKLRRTFSVRPPFEEHRPFHSSPSHNHPPIAVLVSFAEEKIRGKRAFGLQRHLDKCEPCQRMVEGTRAALTSGLEVENPINRSPKTDEPLEAVQERLLRRIVGIEMVDNDPLGVSGGQEPLTEVDVPASVTQRIKAKLCPSALRGCSELGPWTVRLDGSGPGVFEGAANFDAIDQLTGPLFAQLESGVELETERGLKLDNLLKNLEGFRRRLIQIKDYSGVAPVALRDTLKEFDVKRNLTPMVEPGKRTKAERPAQQYSRLADQLRERISRLAGHHEDLQKELLRLAPMLSEGAEQVLAASQHAHMGSERLVEEFKDLIQALEKTDRTTHTTEQLRLRINSCLVVIRAAAATTKDGVELTVETPQFSQSVLLTLRRGASPAIERWADSGSPVAFPPATGRVFLRVHTPDSNVDSEIILVLPDESDPSE